MITLRLYREDTPDRQIDSYIMGEGEVTVGRDPGAIWVLDDPERQLSRFHCTVYARNGEVFVYDTSANGIFLGDPHTRVAPKCETRLPAGEPLRLGRFILVADVDDDDDDQPLQATRQAPLQSQPTTETSASIPAGWSDETVTTNRRADPSGVSSDVVMLEAFCEGAKLDPSYLAGEDPAEIMRRVGEIYQQVVLGLGELMRERASTKSQYSLERTTIGASANNPLKWAPTHRLAVDLLCDRTGGFLNGSEAIRECFEDLNTHSQSLVAGSRAAVSAVLEEFDPKSVESRAKTSFFKERSESCWRHLKSLHADVSDEPFDNPQSLVNLAFRRGYEQRAAELEPGEGTE